MHVDRTYHIQKLNKTIEKLNDNISLLNNYSKDNEILVNLINKLEHEIKNISYNIKKLEQPFLLSIIGCGNYGKSTLINNFINEEFIKLSNLPNTWKIDMFVKSKNEYITILHDDEVLSLNLEEGIKKLNEEELKHKESIKLINKMVTEYKKNKNSNIDELKIYKASLKKEREYKSKIEEVTFFLNKSGILDDFILVDTPGLNQTLKSNTINRVKDYYLKSDGILWILDAQNIMSSTSNDLINYIQVKNVENELNKSMILVVNKIDILRESDVYKVKEKVYKIYKEKFKDIVFISAKQGIEGIRSRDDELIKKSNVKSLVKSIDTNLKEESQKKQLISTYKSISILTCDIKDMIGEYKRNTYKNLCKIIDIKTYINDRISNYTEVLYQVDKIKEIVLDMDITKDELLKIITNINNIYNEKIYLITEELNKKYNLDIKTYTVYIDINIDYTYQLFLTNKYKCLKNTLIDNMKSDIITQLDNIKNEYIKKLCNTLDEINLNETKRCIDILNIIEKILGEFVI